MKGTLGLKKGTVPFENDLETTLVCAIGPHWTQNTPSTGNVESTAHTFEQRWSDDLW